MSEEWDHCKASELCDWLATDLSRKWLSDQSALSVHVASRFSFQDRWATDQWRQQLVAAVHARFGQAGCVNQTELRRWIARQTWFKRLFRKSKRLAISRTTIGRLRGPRHAWPTPEIDTEEQLCQRLGIHSLHTLQWLTLPHRRRNCGVDHYFRRAVRKCDGRTRWLETPLPQLKATQHRIYRDILAEIPVHPRAQAYRPRSSIQTCVSPHVGQRLVLRIDLRNFFGSIHCRRVASLFRRAGYSAPIARLLSQLCCAPGLQDSEAPEELRRSRLPQGAPSSPALSNAIAFRLDRRLSGLSVKLGCQYSRYADDLIFSGDHRWAPRIDAFVTTVAAIAMEEGFAVQFRKTRKLRAGTQQRVLGIVVNERMNLPRRDVEALKATLFNCQRHGWRSQNRHSHPRFREHLLGKVAYVGQFNRRRGAQLLAMFHAIDWR